MSYRMIDKLNLILCSSSHLPSGSGEADFEALYNNDIKPLVSALDKFPRINMALYYSGVILNWIERRHPELFMLLEDLISRKQIEFLGGGFYNPVLPLLPMADKIGQIDMLTTYLRKHFGKRPQGCWLPAMAWEQNLVGPLNSCGMSYTFLEDRHFSRACSVADAKHEEEIYFPCITEDQGKLLTVFPVAGALGPELWNREPRVILEELLEKFTRFRIRKYGNNPALVIPLGGDGQPDPVRTTRKTGAPQVKDGGSKGALPGEFEALFEALSKAENTAEFSSPSRVMKNLHSLKKVYFPFACVRDHEVYDCFHPRQLLADHPEAGGIYTKMIYVHTLINNQLRGDKLRKRTALEELWKAQDSGIYRLGSASSPGLLSSAVRKAAYRSLLEAEKITREKVKFTPSLSVFDFDLDGEGEYIFQDEKLNCYVKPRGAGIFELDYLPTAWNYLDTLGPLSENSGGNSAGNSAGNSRRCGFVDWFAAAKTLPSDAGPEGIKGGWFCGDEEYEVSETDRIRHRLGLKLPRRDGLPWGDIEIEKTWQLRKNSLSLEYILKNSGTKSQRFVFGSSAELSFSGEGDNALKVLSQRDGAKENIVMDGGATVDDIKILEFQDIANETVITLESSRGFDGRIFHLRSGRPGQEEYQSTCVIFLFPVSLDAGKSWKVSFSLRINA